MLAKSSFISVLVMIFIFFKWTPKLKAVQMKIDKWNSIKLKKKKNLHSKGNHQQKSERKYLQII